MAATTSTAAYGAMGPTEKLGPVMIPRRAVGADDVAIDVLYCGVCHSDVHTVRGEWGPYTPPGVPGHEIVGRVTAVGSAVTNFEVGQLAGVGCMVFSCGSSCDSCKNHCEQYCEQGKIRFTYNSPDPEMPGQSTWGGYSKYIVVNNGFVFRITHDESQLAAVAPLLCAGITMYSPLRFWGVGPGQKVGVVGLGGLGHMAVKLAVAMGAEVTVFTTSESKRADAVRLGASNVLVTSNAEALAAHANTFDFILNSVSVSHNLDTFVDLLKTGKTMCLVGAPATPHPPISSGKLVFGRKSIGGSLIGGTAETQEMLDFCAAKGIVADIELVAASYINDAYERMLKSDVKYRFVIDVANSM